jgi:hypothetical protein
MKDDRLGILIIAPAVVWSLVGIASIITGHHAALGMAICAFALACVTIWFVSGFFGRKK